MTANLFQGMRSQRGGKPLAKARPIVEPGADLLNDRRLPGATVAVEGSTFSAIPCGSREPRQFTIAAACKTNRGRWYCTTHCRAFDYQENKDDHLDRFKRAPTECRLVWICLRHQGRPETVTLPRRKRRP